MADRDRYAASGITGIAAVDPADGGRAWVVRAVWMEGDCASRTLDGGDEGRSSLWLIGATDRRGGLVGWPRGFDGIRVIYDDGGAGVAAGDGPNEGDDPADEGPAEEQVQQENPGGGVAPADEGNDRRQEIRDKEHCRYPPTEYEGEQEE